MHVVVSVQVPKKERDWMGVDDKSMVGMHVYWTSP